MSYDKGTLNAYSKIVTKQLQARDLSLTGSLNIGGNIITTGSISGSNLYAYKSGTTYILVVEGVEFVLGSGFP